MSRGTVPGRWHWRWLSYFLTGDGTFSTPPDTPALANSLTETGNVMFRLPTDDLDLSLPRSSKKRADSIQVKSGNQFILFVLLSKKEPGGKRSLLGQHTFNAIYALHL